MALQSEKHGLNGSTRIVYQDCCEIRLGFTFYDYVRSYLTRTAPHHSALLNIINNNDMRSIDGPNFFYKDMFNN